MGAGGSIAWFSGVTLDPIVLNWQTRTGAAGGMIAASTLNAVNDYVLGCKADGIWTTLANGLILPFASDGFAGCTVPLVIPSGGTITDGNLSASNYSLSQGLNLNTNSNAALTTNLLASSLMSLTDAQFSAYWEPPATASGVFTVYAADSNDQRLTLHMTWSDGNFYWDAFSVSTARVSAPRGARNGFFSFTRNNLVGEILNNGTSIGTMTSVASTGTLPTQAICLFNSVLNGGFQQRGMMRYVYLGRRVADPAHYARVHALQTALGRQL